MSDRPTEHDCGYRDGDAGQVMWDHAEHGRCRRCGVQIEYAPTLDDLLGTAD